MLIYLYPLALFSRSPPGRLEAPPSLVARPSLLSPGGAALLWLAGRAAPPPRPFSSLMGASLGLVLFLVGVPFGLVAAAVWVGRGFRDGDPGGPQDPLADLVAGLQDLDARVLRDIR